MASHNVKGTLERCKHSEGWMEVRGGCWHVWGWIILSFQTCTICMFESVLEPSHSRCTELVRWRGWDPLDIQGFLWPAIMAHILGPQPNWPCLINGFEKGHTPHCIQDAIHVPSQSCSLQKFWFCFCRVVCFVLFFSFLAFLWHQVLCILDFKLDHSLFVAMEKKEYGTG